MEESPKCDITKGCCTFSETNRKPEIMNQILAAVGRNTSRLDVPLPGNVVYMDDQLS